jgi:methionyl-tRNA synthetase
LYEAAITLQRFAKSWRWPTKPICIDQNKPGAGQDPERATEVHGVCTQAINMFRVLVMLLKFVLPQLVSKAEVFLNNNELTWDDVQRSLLGTKINAYEVLATRIDPATVKTMLAANQLANEPPQAAVPTVASTPAAVATASTEATIDDFAKLDLHRKDPQCRTGKGSDKLLKLSVDLGELGTRTIFAGIRAAYEPARLIGRLTLVFANLKPRKMRFGVSEGAGVGSELRKPRWRQEIFIRLKRRSRA